MKAIQLNKIQKLYFSTADIAKFFNISPESAKVTASRYVKGNILIRLKRDLYILSNRLNILTDRERFILANLIQTPSYISLTTALSYYNISTQQQQNYIESIELKRTKTVSVKGLTFSYMKIKNTLYKGFKKIEDVFIAVPEKALADAVYLSSLGRYTLDIHALDFKLIKKNKVDGYLQETNRTTKLVWDRICRNFMT